MDAYLDKVAITFHSHYDALRQRRAFKSRGVDSQLVPVPRSLSSSCGTALLIDRASFDASALLDDIEGAFEYKEGAWCALLRP